MNPTAYNARAEIEKDQILSSYGQYLNERKIRDDYMIATYRLYDFHVEICYSLTDKQIKQIIAK